MIYNHSLLKGLGWILLLCLSEPYLFTKTRLYSNWKKKYLLKAKLEATKEAYGLFANIYISNFEDSEKMNIFHRGIEYAEAGGVSLYSTLSNIISFFYHL